MSGGDRPVIGVYGKVEAQADFLRANAGEFSQAGLDRWFEEALELMRTEGNRLPETPTGFLLAPPESPLAFVGAFSPSNDAVGRSFPLVVFAALPAAAVAGAFSNLWGAYGAFIQEAATLAATGAARPVAELTAEVEALNRRGITPAASAGAGAGLAFEPAQALLLGLGGAPRALAYALRTFVTACDQASKAGPDARSGVVTVDAPVPALSVLHLWLELTQRRLRWRHGLPSLLWTDGDPFGRLLLTLGPPSSSAFAYLANARHRSPRFWPLRTDVGPALDQALGALSPHQRRIVENPGTTLADLAQAFGTG